MAGVAQAGAALTAGCGVAGIGGPRRRVRPARRAGDAHPTTAQTQCSPGTTSLAGAIECTTTSYGFSGFGAPVDPFPTVNRAKAGRTIPLKFRVTDQGGAPVTDLASVRVTVLSSACAAGSSADALEEYASGSSGLQNLGDGYYQFNWSTPTAYARSCKTLSLDLGDGVTHQAVFEFTR